MFAVHTFLSESYQYLFQRSVLLIILSILKRLTNRAVLALILGIYLPLSTFKSLQLTAFEIHNADLRNLIEVLPDF